MKVLDKIKINWSKGYVSILKEKSTDFFFLANNTCMSLDPYDTAEKAKKAFDFKERLDLGVETYKIVDTIHITELTGGFKKGDVFRVKATGVKYSFSHYLENNSSTFYVKATTDKTFKLSEIEPYIEENDCYRVYIEKRKERNIKNPMYMQEGDFVFSPSNGATKEFVQFNTEKAAEEFIKDIKKLKSIK